ncbi:MAG: sulfurtransferase complex subunit TusD [Marinobacter sp.]|uniref:sulfurtransferase complex subunit TusD n=1 Tax=Marinobacter sp. TaxID=50741 RepID=UPI00299EA411|nr:sulfurtransferase complex subunit TusD [Marinobacter sp.]MDX1754998.1 sulfurtransferase complex subunit TusD [Marinobacter sp.]
MPASDSVNFTLVITGAPYTSQAPQTALHFARAAIAAGHAIDRVFLYGDGVQLASNLACVPSDEPNWHRSWSEFLTAANIPAVACIASALRRGVINEEERARYELGAANLASPFRLLGLGEWVDRVASTSKVIYFHAGG